MSCRINTEGDTDDQTPRTQENDRKITKGRAKEKTPPEKKRNRKEVIVAADSEIATMLVTSEAIVNQGLCEFTHTVAVGMNQIVGGHGRRG